MIQFAHTENVTWDYLPIGYWSAVESHVGVVVACLPALRSLQRSIRERLFPRPPTSTSYYTDNTKENSKRSGGKSPGSRLWASKTDKSRLSTLGRSHVDKEDFMRLDEFELELGTDGKNEALISTSPRTEASQRSLSHAFNLNEDTQPLASSAAPVGQPTSGILVQTEYSVNRTIPEQTHWNKDKDSSTDDRRFRL